jgi:uncharacterized protein (UPF0332 family)
MNFEYKDCVEKGKIKEYSRGFELAGKELLEGEDDLKTALESFSQDKFKWATVQSYYAMFHAARAMLYHKNFRESSHYCLILAIKELYVRNGLFDVTLLEALSEAKSLREAADYHAKWSKESCEGILTKAKNFIKQAGKIVNAQEK